jgi:hypothetical protein
MYTIGSSFSCEKARPRRTQGKVAVDLVIDFVRDSYLQSETTSRRSRVVSGSNTDPRSGLRQGYRNALGPTVSKVAGTVVFLASEVKKKVWRFCAARTLGIALLIRVQRLLFLQQNGGDK